MLGPPHGDFARPGRVFGGRGRAVDRSARGSRSTWSTPSIACTCTRRRRSRRARRRPRRDAVEHGTSNEGHRDSSPRGSLDRSSSASTRRESESTRRRRSRATVMSSATTGGRTRRPARSGHGRQSEAVPRSSCHRRGTCRKSPYRAPCSRRSTGVVRGGLRVPDTGGPASSSSVMPTKLGFTLNYVLLDDLALLDDPGCARGAQPALGSGACAASNGCSTGAARRRTGCTPTGSQVPADPGRPRRALAVEDGNIVTRGPARRRAWSPCTSRRKEFGASSRTRGRAASRTPVAECKDELLAIGPSGMSSMPARTSVDQLARKALMVEPHARLGGSGRDDAAAGRRGSSCSRRSRRCSTRRKRLQRHHRPEFLRRFVARLRRRRPAQSADVARVSALQVPGNSRLLAPHFDALREGQLVGRSVLDRARTRPNTTPSGVGRRNVAQVASGRHIGEGAIT